MAEETACRIEPCLLTSYSPKLAELIAELVAVSTTLGSALHPTTAGSLAELVRAMNCYYSNLIEGHNTRPREIERALREDFDEDDARRDLQLEARAHIRVQRRLDAQFDSGELGEPASKRFICWLHREFYRDAPPRMLEVEREGGTIVMTPGALRTLPEHDNVVGRHRPPASDRVAAFMEYFESRYALEGQGRVARIVTMAASHHRLNYIHPFIDGNGRVSRLMSHAMALKAGIGAHGLWSISRGLARGLADRGEYRRMMDEADSPRRGDLDGRGNLSLEALTAFVSWFVEVALDQVQLMSELFDLDSLGRRLHGYVVGTVGATEAGWLLVEEVLRRGEMPRGDAAKVSGRSERSARDQLKLLTGAGVLASSTPKGPVSLRFLPSAADELFPRLFVAQAQ